jgi:hypothetical protein
VVKCTQCGYENAEGERLCVKCGLPLDAPGNTRHLDQKTELTNVPRWGTSRLGTERKLLLHVRGYDRPLVVDLHDQLILGRYDVDTGEMPDVNLDPYGAQDMGVSRRHAAILYEDEALKIMDMHSANATYLNGQKLIANQARILRDGDELRLGQLVIRINFA